MDEDLSVDSLAADDYRFIEEEHARLYELLDSLYRTCPNLDNQLNCKNCNSEKLASCRGRLVSSFHNLIYLTDNHFSHEEAIMQNWPHIVERYGQFRMHQQAHADIMDALRNTVDECAGLSEQEQTAESYRRLYRRMLQMLEEHAHLFDDPFIRLILDRHSG
jgi:hemerythrin